MLPAIAPDLRYDALDGVQDGGMAMEGLKEAIDGDCPEDRQLEIDRQQREYCGLDTLTMVSLWEYFSEHI